MLHIQREQKQQTGITRNVALRRSMHLENIQR